MCVSAHDLIQPLFCALRLETWLTFSLSAFGAFGIGGAGGDFQKVQLNICSFTSVLGGDRLNALLERVNCALGLGSLAVISAVYRYPHSPEHVGLHFSLPLKLQDM